MEEYVDKSRVSVRPIYKPLAKDIIEKNHYSGRLSSCRYPLGIFYQTDNEHKFFAEAEEKLVGVACYGFPVGRRVLGSIFSEEILENKNILELTRLFIHDGYGKNIESLALGKSFDWLKQNAPNIKALLSYSDPKVSHKGTIYQATNWIYQGNKTKILESRQFKFEEHGDWLHSRTVSAQYGTNGVPALTKKVGHTFWWRVEPPKHRYVYILAGKGERRKIMKTLKHPPLPYIKELDDEGVTVHKVEVNNKFYG